MPLAVDSWLGWSGFLCVGATALLEAGGVLFEVGGVLSKNLGTHRSCAVVGSTLFVAVPFGVEEALLAYVDVGCTPFEKVIGVPTLFREVPFLVEASLVA